MQGRKASITCVSRCWCVAVAYPVSVSILVMTLYGCGSLASVIVKPEVKRVTMNVVGMDFEKADLMFDVEVENSGPTSVTVSRFLVAIRRSISSFISLWGSRPPLSRTFLVILLLTLGIQPVFSRSAD